MSLLTFLRGVIGMVGLSVAAATGHLAWLILLLAWIPVKIHFGDQPGPREPWASNVDYSDLRVQEPPGAVRKNRILLAIIVLVIVVSILLLFSQ